MFTIEMDWDETAITILDPDGVYEDLQVIAYDDIVYMRQWDEDMNRFILMSFSPKMFLSLMQSFKLPEGAYMLKTEDDL